MSNLTKIKNLTDKLSEYISTKTSNPNIYGCAEIQHKTRSNGFRQMMDNYDIDKPGFIISVHSDQKITVECCVRNRESITKNLHTDRMKVENTTIEINNKELINMIKSTDVDTIRIIQAENNENETAETKDNTVTAYIHLNKEKVKLYQSTPVNHTTDWHSVPMSDLWC